MTLPHVTTDSHCGCIICRPRNWVEVTESRYDDMLGQLPPIWGPLGFLVGEPSTHRRCTVTGNVAADYQPFVRIAGRYFEGCPCMTVAEFKALRPETVLAYCTSREEHAAAARAGIYAADERAKVTP